MNPLFREQLEVGNVGLPAFAGAIRSAGGTAVQVEWAPPGPRKWQDAPGNRTGGPDSRRPE